ncbi:MAG TPA: hypothetical protein DIT13_16465, partial [Verrucomicrobiales bacterium]|nr:hypothetical protein [Verrucomicrobiales bacterium]
AVWRVEDSCITGGSTTAKIPKNYFISTQRSFQNFELRMKIKCSGDPKTGMINSGIQIRSIRDGTAMSGYQVDCGAGWFGKIYDEHRRNRVIWAPTPEQQAALDKAVDVFGWNEYRIRAEGPRIQTWINGVHCIDYTETDPNIALDGHIAPQVHSGGVCLVQVKDVTIEELPATPGAPTWQSIGGLDGMKANLPPKPKAKAKAAASTKRDISYNDVQGVALSAQEQLKKFKLPEGYEIELVVQESEGLGKFVSVYFDQRGRLWTQTALEYPIDANENPAAAEAAYKAHGKDKVLVYPRESLNAKIPAGGLTNPTVFADGLAIPLGILPWGAGDTCYIQHGHDLKLYKDTNGDGKADTFDVVLTGFGVQDSHLFPHQFTRAPGGWIWMAQGLFNNSQVRKPGSDVVIDWPKCSMARMRPDGSEFEVISTGPNNIWGLVITGEGETFIQEANDYGYPVMPFHEYAYYPGGMEALKKSYQPDFPPQADFRMGGTGLSGLALIESGSLSPAVVAQSSVVPASAGSGASEPAKAGTTMPKPAHVMAVANPIISKIQTIAMHRDGAYWKLAQLPDLITCDDPFFRPVALTNGPDGCIYIVDWYNKIISHNEVPRAHPDRDKTRGRIWRVKPKAAKTEVADFTKLSTEELVASLGKEPVAKAHLAWQTLFDQGDASSFGALNKIVADAKQSPAKRVQALWLQEALGNPVPSSEGVDLEHESNRNLRRQTMRVAGNALTTVLMSEGESPENAAKLVSASKDADPEVRFEAIQGLAIPLEFPMTKESERSHIIEHLLAFAKPNLTNGPTIQSSRGPKQIPVREAYDREFERFLVRMFLERHPDIVANYLDTDAAAKLPVEARVLASLALEPKASASRVAKLLPQLDRAPNDEELLRLAQFPEEPGVGEALKALLTNEKSRSSVVANLLVNRTKIDNSQIGRLIIAVSAQMMQSSDEKVRRQALDMVIGFQRGSEEAIIQPLMDRQNRVFQKEAVPMDTSGELVHRLKALTAMRTQEAQLFYVLADSDPDERVREAALDALISTSTNVARSACERLFKLYPKLNSDQRKRVLLPLSGQAEGGAKFLMAAVLDKVVPVNDLDPAVLERLATVLGDDPALEKLQQQLGGIFREVLLLDGQDTAWVDSKITLEGPFTVEAWVRLAPGIGNEDCLLGTPGGIQLNFFQSKFRVYAGPELHDVCAATKPMTPDLWTHLAVTRDEQGICRIYQNGELDAEGTKPATAKWKNCRIGWSGPNKGTEGAIMEFRVWKAARSATEIRASFDRSVGVKALADSGNALFLPLAPDRLKVTLQQGKGARIAKTIDTPPLLTEEQAVALEAKFAKLTALAAKGDPQAGKPFAALCIACHQIGSEGGQIGPNLSGAGAMGLEAVLRNILTPNAAMEPGYRIYRVEMKNGDLIDAFFVSEDKDAVVIRQAGLPDRRLPKADIRSTQFIRRSLMPEGLLDALQDKQVADLLAYLMTLKG